MNARTVVPAGLAVLLSIVGIAAITGAFTTTEQQTIRLLKQRLSALEVRMTTAEADIDTLADGVTLLNDNDIAIGTDIDTLNENDQTLHADVEALDAGMSDLVADEGPLWQLDRNLLALSERVDTFHPPIALTDITPIVVCGEDTCTVDVEWSSDPPATGQVEWGATTDYGTLTTPETDLLAYHRQHLGVLPADGSLYHFRILATVPDMGSVASDASAFVTQ